MMHDREKSDSAIVAGKPTNKAVPTAAESVEPRVEAKGNASQQSTHRTQSRVSVSHALERIRQTVTKKTLCRHTPKVGAECPNGARSVLCRGALSNERPYRDPANPSGSYLTGNSVATLPEAVQTRRGRPFACELRDTVLPLRPTFGRTMFDPFAHRSIVAIRSSIAKDARQISQQVGAEDLSPIRLRFKKYGF